jgi:hypothetical protein
VGYKEISQRGQAETPGKRKKGSVRGWSTKRRIFYVEVSKADSMSFLNLDGGSGNPKLRVRGLRIRGRVGRWWREGRDFSRRREMPHLAGRHRTCRRVGCTRAWGELNRPAK